MGIITFLTHYPVKLSFYVDIKMHLSTKVIILIVVLALATEVANAGPAPMPGKKGKNKGHKKSKGSKGKGSKGKGHANGADIANTAIQTAGNIGGSLIGALG